MFTTGGGDRAKVRALMKPLVMWCRWYEAKLRLYGRSEEEVWGELVFPERSEPFRYDLDQRILTIAEGAQQYTIYLDEMGVEIDETKRL